MNTSTDITQDCPDCGITWTLTAKEADRFKARGLQITRRDQPCRLAARYEREGRPYQITSCDACGSRFTAPFKVQPGREVLCSSCFGGGRS
jgi:CxxC-x17-CxxC domain-containing protein